MDPRFPIYIVSKGRASTRLTAKALLAMRVRFRIVVEEQERDEYAAVLDPGCILVLDPEYQRRYETCDDLGESMSKGSGAARNFAWDHSVKGGAEWHWVMDDNIQDFRRLHENHRILFGDGVCFHAMESFALRYQNVSMVGPQYHNFGHRRSHHHPFRLNTRIYSCNLIRNDTPYRWRGRFNEDTDLSLRMLKDGWCTVLFAAVLQQKRATKRLPGGNTTDLYGNGTVAKSQMIADLHPDVARVVYRWGRAHHHVDYRRFKANTLIRKPGVIVDPDGGTHYPLNLIKEDPARVSP